MVREGGLVMRSAAILLAPLLAIASAAPAHADEFDFVNVLDANGVYYSSISDVINMGKQLCAVGRRAPVTGPAMAQGFGTVLQNGGYTSEAEAKIILGAAADQMCPDIIPRVKAAMASGSQAGNSTGE